MFRRLTTFFMTVLLIISSASTVSSEDSSLAAPSTNALELPPEIGSETQSRDFSLPRSHGTPKIFRRAPSTPQQFRYVTMEPVFFLFDKYHLVEAGKRSLEATINYVQQHRDVQRILIEASADYIGSFNYNDKLSDRRAATVVRYLLERGISEQQIQIISHGEHTPVDENWQRNGRTRNRYVRIHAIHGPDGSIAQRTFLGL